MGLSKKIDISYTCSPCSFILSKWLKHLRGHIDWSMQHDDSTNHKNKHPTLETQGYWFHLVSCQSNHRTVMAEFQSIHLEPCKNMWNTLLGTVLGCFPTSLPSTRAAQTCTHVHKWGVGAKDATFGAPASTGARSRSRPSDPLGFRSNGSRSSRFVVTPGAKVAIAAPAEAGPVGPGGGTEWRSHSHKGRVGVTYLVKRVWGGENMKQLSNVRGACASWIGLWCPKRIRLLCRDLIVTLGMRQSLTRRASTPLDFRSTRHLSPSLLSVSWPRKYRSRVMKTKNCPCLSIYSRILCKCIAVAFPSAAQVCEAGGLVAAMSKTGAVEPASGIKQSWVDLKKTTQTCLVTALELSGPACLELSGLIFFVFWRSWHSVGNKG